MSQETSGPGRYEALAEALSDQGFMARGGFHPAPDELMPPLPDGGQVRSVVMVGNAGSAFWPRFQASSQAQDGQSDPMNRWTEAVLTPLAQDWGAQVVFPFGGPPYLPFQRWAARAEPVYPSPLGMFIHPRYGLWHAYRAAFLFAEEWELPAREDSPSPCDNCEEKPCLSRCPVDAFAPGDYAVSRCVDHIAGAAGATCLQAGCLARHACPIGKDYLYPDGQAGFHMARFLASQQMKEETKAP